MTTKVDICNMALSSVKAGRIDEFNENSPEAVQCRIYYDHALRSLLTHDKAKWGFARATRALALTGNDPEEWEFEYGHPADCLQIHYIIPPDNGAIIISDIGGYVIGGIHYDPIPYEVATSLVSGNQTKVIWTDYENAKIVYTKLITDTLMYDDLFIEALKWRLAVDLALPLGGENGKYYRDTARQELIHALNQAAAFNANQRQMDQRRPARAIEAYGLNNDYYRRGDGSFGVH